MINIGLEIHLQLSTKTKAFCNCSTKFKELPNSNVCPICLGHPGTLPILNKDVIKSVIQLGHVLNCEINKNFIFARKSYFYPDLAKGYQITQSDTPICTNGYLDLIDGKRIHIQRIHMEEDAGKSIHDSTNSLIDYNRCGVPLLEIVSSPDLNSIEEAVEYFKKIHEIVTAIEICDGNMEEGSIRCDANVSITETDEMGQRTEIKNLNSFVNLKNAISAEIIRQEEILKNNQKIEYQTLTFDALNKKTVPLRSKEFAHDYRYFPEPDLVKYSLKDEEIAEYISVIPELPEQKIQKLITKFHLTKYQATILVNQKLNDIFYKLVQINSDKDYIDFTVNFLINGILGYINTNQIHVPLTSINFTLLSKFIDQLVENKKYLNINKAKNLFVDIFFKIKDTFDISDLITKSDIDYNEVILKLNENFPEELQRYKNGEDKLIGFLIGQAIKIYSKDKIDPKVLKEKLAEFEI